MIAQNSRTIKKVWVSIVHWSRSPRNCIIALDKFLWRMLEGCNKSCDRFPKSRFVKKIFRILNHFRGQIIDRWSKIYWPSTYTCPDSCKAISSYQVGRHSNTVFQTKEKVGVSLYSISGLPYTANQQGKTSRDDYLPRCRSDITPEFDGIEYGNSALVPRKFTFQFLHGPD
jgi:hypothetical protein